MEAYTDFAGVYDIFMDETPYEAWLPPFHTAQTPAYPAVNTEYQTRNTLFFRSRAAVSGISFSAGIPAPPDEEAA